MMIESKRWMKHYYKQDIRDMHDYAEREQQKLRILKRIRKSRKLDFLHRLMVSQLIRGSEYDKRYFKRSLKSDKKKLKRLI